MTSEIRKRTGMEDGQAVQPRRSRRGMKILAAVIVLIVAGLAIAWYQVSGKLRTSEAYRAALAIVAKDAQVTGRLGEPVQATWLPPSGSVDGNNATITFQVAGPKGRASAHCESRQFHEKWEVLAVEVTFADDGKKVPLDLAGTGSKENEAPIWRPSSVDQKPSAPPPQNPQASSPSSKKPPAEPATGAAPSIDLELPDVGTPAKGTENNKPPAK